MGLNDTGGSQDDFSKWEIWVNGEYPDCNPSMKLKNKTAIITGAGSGIGRATSLLFAKEGANVAAVDIVEDRAKETLDSILKDGGNALTIQADVSEEKDLN